MHFLPCLHCPTSQTQCVRIHFSRFSCWLWSWGCDSLAANGFQEKKPCLGKFNSLSLHRYDFFKHSDLTHLMLAPAWCIWPLPEVAARDGIRLLVTNLHVGKGLFCSFNIFSGPDCLYAPNRKSSKHPTILRPDFNTVLWPLPTLEVKSGSCVLSWLSRFLCRVAACKGKWHTTLCPMGAHCTLHGSVFQPMDHQKLSQKSATLFSFVLQDLDSPKLPMFHPPYFPGQSLHVYVPWNAK